ncbi:TolB family protein [Paenibacillus pini]|uniref:Periplasmic component of the Tol biopolymer transport system n=1 Tax=Paenibacillus pini JCM 16418 TaxID=1236976 RepID=W7YZ59_9BACL|nr:DPP IV N-terminal domain-containing protein [Paenibacillus pini]GAF07654.1 periplasmic component of the Tol biopolymer transport system [Paenibacillus pini JCM 16418]
MEDVQFDEEMEHFKRSLPINEKLKQELRKSFFRKRRKPLFRRSITAAAIILIGVLVLTPWLSQDKTIPKVAAASLHISNQFSLSEQLGEENSSALAASEGNLYFAIPNKGLYVYGEGEFKKIVAGNISFVRVSFDHTQLVYISDGHLYSYDLQLKKNQRLLTDGQVTNNQIQSPTWSPDGKRIAFVKTVNDRPTIWELNIAKGTVQQITEGVSPSYIAGQQAMIYENNDHIILKDLKKGTSTVLDLGKSPSVSADGAYVAYIKKQGNPTIEDVWIADTDFKTKQQVTENKLSDAWDQLGNIIEGKQQALNTFEQPLWSDDDRSLYVYKIFHTNEVWKEVIRYDLKEEQATPEQIVAGFIQALIYRDEQYAHSFFNYDPGYLKGTNPRQVGFKITNKSQDSKNSYVDAETYLSYTGQPYYQIIKTRYKLTAGTKGYKISGMEEKENIEINGSADKVTLSVNGSEKVLFKFNDDPKQDKWEKLILNNIAYHESSQTLWFTVWQTNDKDGQTNVSKGQLSVMKYDMRTKQFTTLDSQLEFRGSGKLIIDNDLKYIAIEDSGYDTESVVYNLDTKEKTLLSDQFKGEKPKSVNIRFWDQGKLTFYARLDGRDVFFRYLPEQNKIDTGFSK